MAVENNMDDELDQVSAEAMQIIMSAGDARVSCNDALKAIAEGNVESARELIKKAEGHSPIRKRGSPSPIHINRRYPPHITGSIYLFLCV